MTIFISEQMAREGGKIIEKLENTGVSYDDMARKAYTEMRRQAVEFTTGLRSSGDFMLQKMNETFVLEGPFDRDGDWLTATEIAKRMRYAKVTLRESRLVVQILTSLDVPLRVTHGLKQFYIIYKNKS